MAKKTGTEKIIARFKEACKDTELTENFNRFVSNDKSMVTRCNKMIDEHNSLYSEQKTIESLIMDNLQNGRDVSDLVIRRKDLLESIQPMEDTISELKSEIDYNKFLIDRYTVMNEKQLLLWYGILSDIDYIKPGFGEFKATYGHIHF
jgi:hypothetical protein